MTAERLVDLLSTALSRGLQDHTARTIMTDLEFALREEDSNMNVTNEERKFLRQMVKQMNTIIDSDQYERAL